MSRITRLQAIILLHPLSYLALYIAIIPAYAALYHVMDHQFFQSTSQFDTTYAAARLRSEEVLHDTFAPWLKDVFRGHYTIARDDVWVGNLRLKGDDLQFRLSWTVHIPDRPGEMEGEVDLGSTEWTVDLPSPESDGQLNPNGLGFEAAAVPSHLFKLLPNSGSPERRDWGHGLYGAILPQSQPGDYERTISGEIWLDQPIQDELTTFRQAAKGLTVRRKGSFWRFLYFSVTTITTVGFGDIVPLTDIARMAVASEALIGVILAGLFLNSLATRLANLPQSKEPPNSR